MIEIELLREELADVRADAALLRAEIERLKADIKQAESNGIEFELQRDKALAEIEQLQDAINTCRELRKYDRAEIERLRAKEFLPIEIGECPLCKELRANIERLRRALEPKP